MSKKTSKPAIEQPQDRLAVKPVFLQSNLHTRFKKFCVLNGFKMGDQAEEAITQWIEDREGK